MISIDLQNVQSDYINWQALVNKAMLGEKIAILKAGVEVANIIPSSNTKINNDDSIFGFTKGDVQILGDIVSPTTDDTEWDACQ